MVSVWFETEFYLNFVFPQNLIICKFPKSSMHNSSLKRGIFNCFEPLLVEYFSLKGIQSFNSGVVKNVIQTTFY